VARRRNLLVIEDAAQAHGAEYHGRRAGSMGDLGCFSFYPGKNLGALRRGRNGDHRSSEYTRTIRMLRDWGAESKYLHKLKGYNYRMEGFQGAILRVKLRHLEAWTEARRSHAAAYRKLLGGGVSTPEEMRWARHVYHVFAVRSAYAPALQKALGDCGVQTGIHYPIPVHLQEAYRDERYGPGDLPCSERAAEEVLSLPMYANSHMLISNRWLPACTTLHTWPHDRVSHTSEVPRRWECLVPCHDSRSSMSDLRRRVPHRRSLFRQLPGLPHATPTYSGI